MEMIAKWHVILPGQSLYVMWKRGTTEKNAAHGWRGNTTDNVVSRPVARSQSLFVGLPSHPWELLSLVPAEELAGCCGSDSVADMTRAPLRASLMKSADADFQECSTGR